MNDAAPEHALRQGDRPGHPNDQAAAQASRSAYLSPEHRAWRKAVCDRAGWRCEWIDENGQRCTKAAPVHRIFADHKQERQDAPGAELDVANGWCLCGAHHSLKTAKERDRRLLGG